MESNKVVFLHLLHFQLVNTDKIYHIGNTCIEETNAYKYLGVMFARSLSDLYHVKTCCSLLKPRRLKDIASILARHGYINRVEFGHTLWSKVVLSPLLHGCGTWLKLIKSIYGQFSIKHFVQSYKLK